VSVPGGGAARPPGRWHDLRTRALSAAVLIAVGGVEIWLGGITFAVLAVVVSALMLWELARITAPARLKTARMLALTGLAALVGALVLRGGIAPALLLVPALFFALTPRRDRRISAAYAAAVMVAGYGLVSLREEQGGAAILWLVAVVVTSDVLGYFVGRSVGGPKFWPAISPKKTWSGTAAGWAGAAAVGAVFVWMGLAPWTLILLSPVVAFAGQLGDICESWIKRRTGVKDSSRLIPGHGGVMDRFDALVGAVVAVMLLALLLPLPVPVGG
jgi:phosphatidate cytidylyltransferase